MAWLSAGEKPTATKLNAGTAAGIATGSGNLIVTTGVNTVEERTPTTDDIATSETTASATFADLATAGPAVTVTTGTAPWSSLPANYRTIVPGTRQRWGTPYPAQRRLVRP